MDDSLKEVLEGRCIHGQQGNCLTCTMTRYMAQSLRRMLEARFPLCKNK